MLQIWQRMNQIPINEYIMINSKCRSVMKHSRYPSLASHLFRLYLIEQTTKQISLFIWNKIVLASCSLFKFAMYSLKIFLISSVMFPGWLVKNAFIIYWIKLWHKAIICWMKFRINFIVCRFQKAESILCIFQTS